MSRPPSSDSFSERLPSQRTLPTVSLITIERLTGVLFVVYLLLLGLNSITRTHFFGLDPMNYVDVSRNIARGRGVSQSSVGLDWPSGDTLAPQPYTIQAPLFPAAIAAVHALGLPFDNAGLLVPILSFGYLTVVIVLMIRSLYGRVAGLLALGCLLLYLPSRIVTGSAWSEPLGTALVVTTLYLLLREPKAGSNRFFVLVLAGLCAGLAFATRYVFALIVPVGLLFLLLQRQPLRIRIVNGLVFGLAASLPTAAVLAHNLVSAHLLLPTLLPSTLDLAQTTSMALENLFGHAFSDDFIIGQVVLAALIAVIFVTALVLSRRPFGLLRGALLRYNRWLLLLWSVVYLVALTLWRARSHFDALTGRLLFPGSVVLLALAVALLVRAVRRDTLMTGVAVVVALLAVGQQLSLLILTPLYDPVAPIAASPRLSWLAQHTSDQDLIMGTDVVDVPFYLDRPLAISFSTYPYSPYLTQQQINSFVCRYQDQYRSLYLVIRRLNPQRWRLLTGPFITALVTGSPPASFQPVASLRDALIFRVTCDPFLS